METTIHSRYNRERKDGVDLDRVFGVASGFIGLATVGFLCIAIWTQLFHPVTDKIARPLDQVASSH